MKIVIVDDEQIILAWLKKSLEALSPDYQVVQTCVNGQQALEYCLQHPVDILFTDICMPAMDGIELIRMLKAKVRMPYTVILTAYDDFVYVREALKLGAKEFLLKAEITEQSLLDCMNLAYKTLQPEKNKVGVSPLTAMLMQFVQEEVVDLELLKTALGEKFGQGIGVLLVQTESAKKIQQCKEMLLYVYAEENLIVECVELNSTTFVVFSKHIKKRASFYRTAKTMLGSFGLKNCYLAGASSVDVEEVENVWKEAKRQLEYYQFYCNGKECDFTPEQRKGLEEQETQSVQLIEIDEYEQAIKSIERWLDSVEKMRPPIAQIKRSALGFLLLFYWEKLSEERRKLISVEEICAIVQSTDFVIFHQLLINQLDQLLLLLMENSKSPYNPAVIEVMLFIKKNYHRPLSLEDIASEVHLNRTYLSSLFKKETKTNLSDYLQGCRIDAAKELLLHSEQSVQQVSEQVGILDAAYFSKIFNKHVGITPVEFRKRNKI